MIQVALFPVVVVPDSDKMWKAGTCFGVVNTAPNLKKFDIRSPENRSFPIMSKDVEPPEGGWPENGILLPRIHNGFALVQINYEPPKKGSIWEYQKESYKVLTIAMIPQYQDCSWYGMMTVRRISAGNLSKENPEENFILMLTVNGFEFRNKAEADKNNSQKGETSVH